MLYSLSKSFASTAIGLAIQEGLITIDDPVISFFPELAPEDPSQHLQAMRIRDLITMNTGHEQDASRRMMGHPKGWVAGFLSLEVEHKPGTIFVYNSGATYMLSAIIQKVTGMPVVEYLQSRLFDPLEIKAPTWESDPEGINVGGWGLSVTTLDIAKLGQLYLQKGNWKGEQILSEEWVNTATSLQTSNGSNPESDWDQGYGYQFWRCRYNNYRGDGAFGQYCIVMPEKDAVIAITAASNDMQGILNMVWEHLLPAMEDKPLPENEEAQTELNTRLEKLALATVEGEASSPLAPEVSGLRYELKPNAYELEAVEFDMSNTNGENFMTVWSPEGQHTFPVGFKTMPKGRMNLPGQVPWATAASGAWVSDDHYRVLVYNYESPHALTFDFVFSEGGQSLTWDGEYNVTIWSPRKLERMEGALEEVGVF